MKSKTTMKFKASSLSLSATVLLVMASFVTPNLAVAQSGSTEGGQSKRGPGGPPPQEAFDACANLSASDSCSVETPKGTLEGSCQIAPRGEEELVCMPAR